MRKRAAVAFLVVAVCALAAVAIEAAGDERDLAFTIGVAPGLVAAELPPGAEACQVPVPVAESFTGVELQLGTYRRPGPPMAVAIRAHDGGRTLATGRLDGGYPDVSRQRVALRPAVVAGERVDVCVRNLGGRRLAIYGGPAAARRGSTVEVDGRDLETDLTLAFTTQPRSVLSQVAEIFDRASLFRPAWLGPWTFWALGALIVLVAPIMLALALATAVRPVADDRADRGDRRLAPSA